jgi:hypothetical protein
MVISASVGLLLIKCINKGAKSMNLSTETKLNTFEEASAYVRKVGILPLSSFIPDYYSLESLTVHEQWHTGLASDPWLWRDRFAGEGVAAYGRFFAKKPLLIAAEWFPLVKNVLEEPYTIHERYDDGLLPKATVDLYQAVSSDEGIDVKQLRAKIGMTGKESKNEFDRSIIELQGTTDLVIAGISERLNANGVKSGWNSTCYMTAEHWMELHCLPKNTLSSHEAKGKLRALIEERCEGKARAYLIKVLGL